MGLFAIGVPFTSSADGISPYGPYDPLRPDITQFTFAGTYGAPDIRWYTDIRDPNALNFQPAAPSATNLQGMPLVVSYDRMTWGYTKIRPDEWYYLRNVFRLARRGNKGLVRVRFPQPAGIVETSAVWEQLPQTARNVGYFSDVALTFSQLGRTDNSVPDLVWLPMGS